LHGNVDVGSGTLRNGSQLFSIGRVDGVEICSCRGSLPLVVNKVSEAMAVAFQPRLRLFCIFRSRSVLHRNKFFSDAHVARFSYGSKQPVPNYAMG
jgi:hypothetical protein